MSEPASILLSGMLAGTPGQGGATWAVLQYLLGLRRLGHDVTFVEPVEGLEAAGPGGPSARLFDAVADRFGLHGEAALLDPATGAVHGLARADLQAAADRADVLLNISGVLTDDDLVGAADVRVFVDLDPGFTQLWVDAEGVDLGFDRHDRFVTIGQSIGAPGSRVPSCGLDWIDTLQPVVLEHWPEAGPVPPGGALTTVGNWRSYGSIHHDGVHYGQKAHALRPLFDLPERTGASFVLALGIDPAETDDLEALAAHGWTLVDPVEAAGTPERYADFVRGSRAEFGLAKSGYVEAACGWFSDRSVCYLASGRPVIAQDTGFGAVLPTGEGLFAFAEAEGVAVALEALESDYGRHARAARELAEDLFDSDLVLARLLACL